MRDRDTIDAELRRLAALRRSMREHGGELSSRRLDELLDERLGHRAAPSETASTYAETDRITPRRGRRVLRRVGPVMLLPLSLVAAATVLVVMFTAHNHHPAAQPTQPRVVPPSGAPPTARRRVRNPTPLCRAHPCRRSTSSTKPSSMR
ncbi:hypothetical protein I553_1558 [Mycobacterium xenopi 4042]|uniref:Uncharacterized protein n=1 Tax=Mycobacterium xenopi 4042 TaxID=1299334 RepID=X8CEH1_MYCXE|nr:hypothetical protein I553_1558 [Mycobacterium xenopi 4042]